LPLHQFEVVLTLDASEVQVLREILISARTQLRVESSRADSHDVRVALHEREHTVDGLLTKLREEAVRVAGGREL
jgi:hypothetical protein